jgi:hypothetical protein
LRPQQSCGRRQRRAEDAADNDDDRSLREVQPHPGDDRAREPWRDADIENEEHPERPADRHLLVLAGDAVGDQRRVCVFDRDARQALHMDLRVRGAIGM